MAITLNDNININAGKPLDGRYFNGNSPWVSIVEVNSNIPESYRYRGLTVNINNTEYWYFSGVTDSALVNKETVGIIGALNGTQVIDGNKIGLGGALTGDTTISGTYTLNISDGAKLNTTCGYQISGETVFNTTTTCNIAIGAGSLSANTTGYKNIGIGYRSLYSNISGINNIAIGCGSLCGSISGNSNIGIGGFTLQGNTTGCDNIGIGIGALNEISGVSLNNIAIGRYSLRYVTGDNNVGLGYYSLYCNTGGTNNFAVGYQALYSNVIGCNNTAIGYQALYNNCHFEDLDIADNNVAIGFQALYSNTYSCHNTAIGKQALYKNTVGSANIAIGNRALYENTQGYNNVAFGDGALQYNTEGINNIAIGNDNLQCNTTGNYNTAFNRQALHFNETGCHNFATGNNALYSNTIGCNNTAIGYRAAYLNTTGCHNFAVGCESLCSNVTGSSNIAIGENALKENTIGNNNIGIGPYAGKYETTNNNLYVDVIDRTSAITGCADSLIVGKFDAEKSGQTLTFNANTKISATGTGNTFTIDNGTAEIFQVSDIKLKTGDIANDNYSEIRNDGTIRSYGAATAWQDMIMDLFGKRLYATAGKVDYDYDENTIVFASGGNIATTNDRVGGNQEINHDFRVSMTSGETVSFFPHIHWWQQVTSNAVLPIVFSARYRVQKNGEAKTTSWITIEASGGTVNDIFDFTSEADGLYNQITSFDDIDITDVSVSDTIQIQMTRTDSEAGNVSIYFFDIHGEVDSFGSDGVFSKT